MDFSFNIDAIAEQKASKNREIDSQVGSMESEASRCENQANSFDAQAASMEAMAVAAAARTITVPDGTDSDGHTRYKTIPCPDGQAQAAALKSQAAALKSQAAQLRAHAGAIRGGVSALRGAQTATNKYLDGIVDLAQRVDLTNAQKLGQMAADIQQYTKNMTEIMNSFNDSFPLVSKDLNSLEKSVLATVVAKVANDIKQAVNVDEVVRDSLEVLPHHVKDNIAQYADILGKDMSELKGDDIAKALQLVSVAYGYDNIDENSMVGEFSLKDIVIADYFSEIENEYPGLLDILLSNYGSVYLEAGMKDKTIQFLTDAVNKNKNGISLIDFDLDKRKNLDTASEMNLKELEMALLLSAHEKIVSRVWSDSITQYSADVHGLFSSMPEYKNAYHQLYLDKDLLNTLSKYADDRQVLVSTTNSAKTMEENKEHKRIMGNAWFDATYIYVAANAYQNDLNKVNSTTPKKIYGNYEDEFSYTNQTSGYSTYSRPQDFLRHALNRQGLAKPPKRFKEKFKDDEYKYEVRIHEGESQYTNANRIYRVQRQTIPDPNSKVQGSGQEYLDIHGNWHHKSTLTPSDKLGNLNPNYNAEAAKNTHIPLD